MPANSSKKTLVEKLKSELGGNYGEFMRFLVESRHSFNGEHCIAGPPAVSI